MTAPPGSLIPTTRAALIYDAYPEIALRDTAPVKIDDVARLAESLAGVRRTATAGLAQWRYHGRLVARQLDDAHVVIRADFDARDLMLRQFPETFSVPSRFAKHMMVVADLARADAGAIEDAIEAAWLLQRSADAGI
jgi:hypothetical protein